jgi:uncharacterized membrane-anchored protein YitT (DUF2179 family)
MKKAIVRDAVFILLGSFLYGVSTHFFIFPKGILLGGTSGISVILSLVLPVSAGKISTVINLLLILVAFIVLGKGMAIKTFIGSALTTLFIGGFDLTVKLDSPIINNVLLSSVIGAFLIAVASTMLFKVDSSSGGTDIIALIIGKFSSLNLGIALLISDFIIVLSGFFLYAPDVAAASFIGYLIKTLGIAVATRRKKS